MRYYVIAGGTFSDVAPHFALAAPAFGRVGRQLAEALPPALAAAGREGAEVRLLLTRMALGGAERDARDEELLAAAGLADLYSNADVAKLIDHLVAAPKTRALIVPAALCDFEPAAIAPSYGAEIGKASHPRLSSRGEHQLLLKPAAKVVRRVRAQRKDVFLALFKNTAGDDAPTLYAKGLALLKRCSANLVLANDSRTQLNMVITPEQARYHEGPDRGAAVRGFAEMIALRTGLRFTRSTIAAGEPVAWQSAEIPESLRVVVDHCIRRGAYKPFLGSTVGHFAARGNDGTILTSRRKTDFNDLARVGLVRIEPRGEDDVVAYGAKPSVGGQSQRIIFREHPEVDCIVHFHCPRRADSPVPVREQRPYECGSHECGRNTADGLAPFAAAAEDGASEGSGAGVDVIKAVMLDRHGPNVAFPRGADPARVIDFIERNFDLQARTDGEVNLSAVS